METPSRLSESQRSCEAAHRLVQLLHQFRDKEDHEGKSADQQ